MLGFQKNSLSFLFVRDENDYYTIGEMSKIGVKPGNKHELVGDYQNLRPWDSL